jgi:hypothetical protein
MMKRPASAATPEPAAAASWVAAKRTVPLFGRFRAGKGRRASSCALLDLLADDQLLHVLSYLPTASDLARVQLSCKRLGGARSDVAETLCSLYDLEGEGLSLVEQVARQSVLACTEQERGWVPRRNRERWPNLLREVELLRQAARFDRVSRAGWTDHVSSRVSSRVSSYREREYVHYVDRHQLMLFARGAVVSVSTPTRQCAVASSVVPMRSGRHFAQFMLSSADVMLGVIRPEYRSSQPQSFAEAILAESNEPYRTEGHWFYHAKSGNRFPDDRWGDTSSLNVLVKIDALPRQAPDEHKRNSQNKGVPHSKSWRDDQKVLAPSEGRPFEAGKQGDRIGLLLDFERGITVYKNDKQIGRMVSSALKGRYCWAVVLRQQGSVRIDPAALPATEDDGAGAPSWHLNRRDLALEGR